MLIYVHLNVNLSCNDENQIHKTQMHDRSNDKLHQYDCYQVKLKDLKKDLINSNRKKS